MKQNLLDILKTLVTEHGHVLLSNSKRVSAFFADLARDIPKPQKTAFLKCLEHDFPQLLKNADESERENCKQQLAQKLNEEEGLELSLCEVTLNLLATVLFGEEKVKKDNKCKNCGKELQDEWKNCPFCSAVKNETSNLKQTCAATNSNEKFNVVLLSFSDENKIPIIKEIRLITDSGLKEAKDIAEGVPNYVITGVSKEEAAIFKNQLVLAGGTVEIQSTKSSGSGSYGYGIQLMKPKTCNPNITANNKNEPQQTQTIPQAKNTKGWFEAFILIGIFIGLFVLLCILYPDAVEILIPITVFGLFPLWTIVGIGGQTINSNKCKTCSYNQNKYCHYFDMEIYKSARYKCNFRNS
ncbi:MAG: ribosomal protein L7/L12 [Treponema sp.]|nr:ribosomal protein L7/L12 [Treponema sp.]